MHALSRCLMSLDPVETNPHHYKVVFENDRVRVLEYTDRPGEKTTPHEHPDSVMYTLSTFRRRLVSGEVDAALVSAPLPRRRVPAARQSAALRPTSPAS